MKSSLKRMVVAMMLTSCVTTFVMNMTTLQFYHRTITTTSADTAATTTTSMATNQYYHATPNNCHDNHEERDDSIAPLERSDIIPSFFSSSSYDRYLKYDHTDYIPATFEEYVYRNSEYLGLTNRSFSPSGCYLWGIYNTGIHIDDNSDAATTKNQVPNGPSVQEQKYLRLVPNDIRQDYLDHVTFMDDYQTSVYNFQLSLPYDIRTTTTTSSSSTKRRRYSDVREALRHYNHSVVCDPLHIPWGGMMAKSIMDLPTTKSTLSHMTYSTTGGTTNDNSPLDRQWIEPLLPQLRHAGLCVDRDKYLLNMSYMVHDFRFICHSMTPHSRTIFVDMGGSLLFHSNTNPAITMAKLYEQFGIRFDHVYAYEMTPFGPSQLQSIFQSKLPPAWETSYHWINVGVDSTVGSKLNPFTMIKEHFQPEDFIVVKLDIDTPSVELPLVQQLLRDLELHTLIDQFYFEYHVKLKELRHNWGDDYDGTIYDALHLMTQLREKGIAAHFWV